MSDTVCLFVSTELLDPISRAIGWREDDLWTHTGFERLSDHWTFSAMADGHGVDWRKPNTRSDYRILRLSAPGTQEAFEQALKYKGQGYDFIEALGTLLGHDWQTPGRLMCSHLTFPSYAVVGKPLLNHHFTPFEKLLPSHTLLSKDVAEL